ncbi:MAG TPA: methyltransferase [Oligoflexia bacterium]|nr:methyltransferase [Oligoflexia bacterium]HMP26541.1 methyltransferase [Oligoflexia bacterium]
MDEAKALLFFFEKNPQFLAKHKQVLFIRGRDGIFARHLKESSQLAIYQTHKPFYDQLSAGGFSCLEELKGEYDIAILICGKNKQENLYNTARAFRYLKPNGTFIGVISNEHGSGSYLKHLNTLSPTVQSVIKHKSRVCQISKDSHLNFEILRQSESMADQMRVAEIGLITTPGVFSAVKVDRGSKFLADNLPADLSGSGADLGAGYGYLGWRLLNSTRQIQALASYDAELEAIRVSKKNLEKFQNNVKLEFFWSDVTNGLGKSNLDFVVLNPPFHQERRVARYLGERFICAGAEALRKGGRLYLVANQFLPYEKILVNYFQSVKQIDRANGFKVLVGVR